MAHPWLRLWHDMPNDPVWRVIARRSKRPVTEVISVFIFVLVNASERSGTEQNAPERGRTFNLHCDDIAAALDMEEDDVQSILVAMQGKVLDGDRLTGWVKRQPEREDPTGAERQARFRRSRSNTEARTVTQRNAKSRKVTHGHTPDTDTDTDTEYGDDGRAREATDTRAVWDSVTLAAEAARRGGVAHISAKAISRNVEVIAELQAEGIATDTILKTIGKVLAGTDETVSSLKYFAPAIRRAHALLENPYVKNHPISDRRRKPNNADESPFIRACLAELDGSGG